MCNILFCTLYSLLKIITRNNIIGYILYSIAHQRTLYRYIFKSKFLLRIGHCTSRLCEEINTLRRHFFRNLGMNCKGKSININVNGTTIGNISSIFNLFAFFFNLLVMVFEEILHSCHTIILMFTNNDSFKFAIRVGIIHK